MAFGVKTKNIKTQNSYTIESFFDAIKDKEFTAGTPSLTKHGMATVITFPALDRSESGLDYEERFRQGNAEIFNSKVHSGGYGQCS